jgi:hypothetical protein
MSDAKNQANHPWQNTPTELFQYAIVHLERGGDFDLRIGFLLLDIGVETLFKTYLLLPAEVTGTKLGFTKRKDATTAENFHILIVTLKEAASEKLEGLDLFHIEYYHNIRNKLYHQGEGISVTKEKVNEYAQLGKDCLRRLLGVDLETIDNPFRKGISIGSVMARDEIYRSLSRIRNTLGLLVERINSDFLLASFYADLTKWRNKAWGRPEAFEQSTELIPKPLIKFLAENNLHSALIRFVRPEDQEDFFLIIVDVLHKIPALPEFEYNSQERLSLSPVEFYRMVKRVVSDEFRRVNLPNLTSAEESKYYWNIVKFLNLLEKSLDSILLQNA